MKIEDKKVTDKKTTIKTKILKFLHWTKVATRFVAVCSTIGGTIATIGSSSAATTGMAFGAAGATSYAATKIPTGRGYEKIKHIPPRKGIKAFNEGEKTSIDYSLWSDEKKQLKKAYSDAVVI